MRIRYHCPTKGDTGHSARQAALQRRRGVLEPRTMSPLFRATEIAIHPHPDRLRTLRGWSRPATRTPATLDRLADLELAHGRHRAADRLALLADELREVA